MEENNFELSKVIEILKNKNINTKFRIQIYKKGKYYARMFKASRELIFFDKPRILQLIADNISDNLMIGYEENRQSIFYIIVDRLEKVRIKDLSKEIPTILKIENTTYLKTLNKYIIKYSLPKDLEIQVTDDEISKILYENI